MPVGSPTEAVAQKERAASRSNRRFAIRYAASAAVASGIGDEEGLLFRRARVFDLSQGGMALILPRPLTAGTDLCIQVTNRSLGFSFDLNAQVRHVTSHGRGQWIVGLAFPRELTLAELASLL